MAAATYARSQRFCPRRRRAAERRPVRHHRAAARSHEQPSRALPPEPLDKRCSKTWTEPTLDDYDFSFQPDLDPRKVKDLATLSFVEDKANVALLGPPGVGKTHIAVALAVAACRAGYSIYFTSLDDMVRHLEAAEDQGRLMSKLTSYLRPAVLVVDEVGYQPLERAEANLVFQVISKRYEKGSIILTSNKTFGEWGQIFGDEVLATAILDRLLHHCEVVPINGNSYRLKNRLQAIERDTDVA